MRVYLKGAVPRAATEGADLRGDNWIAAASRVVHGLDPCADVWLIAEDDAAPLGQLAVVVPQHATAGDVAAMLDDVAPATIEDSAYGVFSDHPGRP